MGTIKKEIAIGVLVALFATAAGFFFYLQYFSRFGFYETLEFMREGKLYGKVLSLATIPNLFVFFVFIKKKQDHRAKGVLMTTIFIALATLVLKFF